MNGRSALKRLLMSISIICATYGSAYAVPIPNIITDPSSKLNPPPTYNLSADFTGSNPRVGESYSASVDAGLISASLSTEYYVVDAAPPAYHLDADITVTGATHSQSAVTGGNVYFDMDWTSSGGSFTATTNYGFGTKINLEVDTILTSPVATSINFDAGTTTVLPLGFTSAVASGQETLTNSGTLTQGTDSYGNPYLSGSKDSVRTPTWALSGDLVDAVAAMMIPGVSETMQVASLSGFGLDFVDMIFMMHSDALVISDLNALIPVPQGLTAGDVFSFDTYIEPTFDVTVYSNYYYDTLSAAAFDLPWPIPSVSLYSEYIDQHWVGGEYYTLKDIPAGFTYHATGSVDIIQNSKGGFDFPRIDPTKIFQVMTKDPSIVTHQDITIDISQVPEPGTIFMLGSGLAGLALTRRRFKA